MIHINDNFLKLQSNYLFADIAKKVAAYKEAHPDKKLIRLGIGDVTRPLPEACLQAMHKAVDEYACSETFRGYGPEHGYRFLIEAIIQHDFTPRGISLTPEEVFISDGAKSDIGNISDILGGNNMVGVTDPIYPVYIDSNVMAGRAGDITSSGLWNKISYFPCTAENQFVPELPQKTIDIIYLCYPNNPTGTTLTKKQLKEWVDYALENKSLILFDAAYEAYIQEKDIPHSIYEIEGARQCAIEFRSFSKTAGFTGVRCGYTIVPKEVVAYTKDGQAHPLNSVWDRRQCTKFNGVSYITQRGAEAVFSDEGQKQVCDTIRYYKANASLMREILSGAGFEVFGGINSPYIWLKVPNGETSWSFFQYLLSDLNIVGTPGVGFGPSGEGYFRLTAFGLQEDCVEAMERIKAHV